jgi:hypothetical protein
MRANKITSTFFALLLVFNTASCSLDSLFNDLDVDISLPQESDRDSSSSSHSESMIESSSIHEHEYSSSWTYDDKYHWKEAVCEHKLIKDREKHSFSNWLDNGQEKTRYCTECGYVEYKKEVEEHTHSYNVVENMATCTTSGYKEYTCTCGYSYIEEIKALGTALKNCATALSFSVSSLSFIKSKSSAKSLKKFRFRTSDILFNKRMSILLRLKISYTLFL